MATFAVTTFSRLALRQRREHLQIKPLGIVRPRSTADVAAFRGCMPRSNGFRSMLVGPSSGLAGESLGRGLVLDFRVTCMRSFVPRLRSAFNWRGAWVVERTPAANRIFGPDPSVTNVTTMGSVLAIDASGSHWPQYGSARRHVESLQVVLADGAVIEAGRHSLAEADQALLPERQRSGHSAC